LYANLQLLLLKLVLFIRRISGFARFSFLECLSTPGFIFSTILLHSQTHSISLFLADADFLSLRSNYVPHSDRKLFFMIFQITYSSNFTSVDNSTPPSSASILLLVPTAQTPVKFMIGLLFVK